MPFGCRDNDNARVVYHFFARLTGSCHHGHDSFCISPCVLHLRNFSFVSVSLGGQTETISNQTTHLQEHVGDVWFWAAGELLRLKAPNQFLIGFCRNTGLLASEEEALTSPIFSFFAWWWAAPKAWYLPGMEDKDDVAVDVAGGADVAGVAGVAGVADVAAVKSRQEAMASTSGQWRKWSIIIFFCLLVMQFNACKLNEPFGRRSGLDDLCRYRNIFRFSFCSF